MSPSEIEIVMPFTVWEVVSGIIANVWMLMTQTPLGLVFVAGLLLRWLFSGLDAVQRTPSMSRRMNSRRYRR